MEINIVTYIPWKTLTCLPIVTQYQQSSLCMGIALAEAVGAGLVTAGGLRAGAGLMLAVLKAAAGRVEPPWVFAAATEGCFAPVFDSRMVELGRILMLAHRSSTTGVKSSAIVVNPSSKSVLPILNGVEGQLLPRRSIPT